MSVQIPTSAGRRALREHLHRDAPVRELSVARFMTFASGTTAVMAVALLPLIGWKLSLSLGALLGSLAGAYYAQTRAFARGWYHPAISWVNVAIECSMPAIIFMLDTQNRGAEYALSAPPWTIWGTLVALSGLRANRSLALGAGAIAAAECLLVYFLIGWPRLGPDALVTYQPAMILTRAFLLFCAGMLTAVFVTHFNRRSEEAFTAMRERDFFGKYLLHERVGAGGMAEVFRATYSPEGGFEKQVAVKRILPSFAEDTQFLKSFRAEAELCSRLNHPGIVQVLDFGRYSDSYFLAMEYVDGLSLKRVLDVYQGKGLPIAAVSFLAHELLQALDYVHRRVGPTGEPLGLIHRDLNPPNILISKMGEVKIADFGVARAASGEQTQAGLIKGKVGYLAPEQAAGEALDGRVDLFALGATLHECITGERLFPVGEDLDTLRAVYTMEIRSPIEARPETPRALEAVVMRLLQRDVLLRTPSAKAALEQLGQLSGPDAPFPSGPEALQQVMAHAAVEWPKMLNAATERASRPTAVVEPKTITTSGVSQR